MPKQPSSSSKGRSGSPGFSRGTEPVEHHPQVIRRDLLAVQVAVEEVATRARDPFTLVVVRQVVPADVQLIAHVTRNRHIVYAGLERYVHGGGIARREHAAPETQEFGHAEGEGTIAGQSQTEPRRRRFAEEATVAHASPGANEVNVGCAGQQLRGAAAE